MDSLEHMQQDADQHDDSAGVDDDSPLGVPADDLDDSLADHFDNIQRAREQMDGLRRGMGLD